MAWTTPPTFTAGAVLTAAQLNILRDDLNETAAAKATSAGQYFVATGSNSLAARSGATASVTTTEQTTATTFQDLNLGGAPGPSVTVTSGTRALVCVHTRLTNTTAGAITHAGWTVSGATTVAASDDFQVAYESSNANDNMWASGVHFYTGLTSGSNTFRMVYKVSAGTGSVGERRISVLPF